MLLAHADRERLHAARVDIDCERAPAVLDAEDSDVVFKHIHIEKPTYHGASRYEKRMFDTCFAVLALAFASPILLVADSTPRSAPHSMGRAR